MKRNEKSGEAAAHLPGEQAMRKELFMKRSIAPILMVAVLGLSSCATKNAAQTGQVPIYQASAGATPMASQPMEEPPSAASPAWPVVFEDGGNIYTIYEPQSDSWDGHQLAARSAVAVQPGGGSQPVYGVITFNAITLVDKSTRTASLASVSVQNANFPKDSDRRGYSDTLRRDFPNHAPAMALDTLEAGLSIPASPSKAERLNNAPPKIVVSTHPAVLVSVDGAPAWRPVAGTQLQRVINTRALLLKDQAGRFYLHLFDGYLVSSSLDGPWKVASVPPAGADAAEKLATDSGQVDLLKGEPDATTHQTPSLKTTITPEIFVATTPSELITFTGQPEYAAIPGTDLLYASNTSGDVFKLLTDQKNYILISGRWYRAASLDGPWQFVPGNQLPKDFANIPDASPKENVKASVPGTSQAAEALIANSIPQSTAVARSAPMQAPPQTDGPMQLAPIEGTPLHYVVNSATPIIEVDPQSWYSCENGVWYVSTSPNGSWTVAASVPAVIYTIPPSSPLHYLTYVQVYGATPDVVYEGYTPGYLGTEVADDGTVVYGTGYDYEPWIGSVWIGPPVTWGCGFEPCWTPWWGWGYDCGFGWGWGFDGFAWDGCFPPFPWWCGFHDFDHDRFGHDWHDGDGHRWHDRWNGADHGYFASTGANLYHHHDNFGGQRSGTGFNDSGRHQWSGDLGRAYNSRTGQLAAGEHAQVRSVPGSAWHPDNRSNFTQRNYAQRGNNYNSAQHGFGMNNRSFDSRGGYNGFAFNAPHAAPSRSWAWSAPSHGNPNFHGGDWGQSFEGRGFGQRNYYAPPRVQGGIRAPNSFGGFGGGFGAPHGGEMFRGGGGGGFFHGGDGGGFHGGGGGSFHGGGGGGFHGGGGGGGGHGGGGGGGHR